MMRKVPLHDRFSELEKLLLEIVEFEDASSLTWWSSQRRKGLVEFRRLSWH